MDRARIAAMIILRRRLRRKRRRLHWVHPINTTRLILGAFYTLFEVLRGDEKKFFNYFRMSVSSFDNLHLKLKASLQRQDTKLRNCIQPIEMMAIAIRYLATGCTFKELHYTYRVGSTTASKIVRDVCRSIWSVMRVECLPELTLDKWKTTAMDFEKRANFPHCLGAVDGKHIRLVCPAHSGSMFYNYKEYNSLVLMAVADSNYCFMYVDVGSYGKECDSTVFKRSSLWKSIEEKTIELPNENYLPGIESHKLPYFFIGDEAFALHKHLLRPFGGNNLTVTKRIFNYRLCRARRYVECTFGILSNKWRIFHRAINVNPDFAVDMVKACVVLHNYVRRRDGYQIEDTMSVIGFDDLPAEPSIRGSLLANNVRNELAEYFQTNVGSVSWQMSKI